MQTPTNAAAGPRPRLVAGLRLLQLVGSGGEGEVWEARDERGRRRALKLIRPDALAPDAEERSRHLLAIDHPAFVRVFGGGRIDEGVLAGWGFLEMAFIDGPSLQDAAPDPAVLERLWPLAEALDLLHTGFWTEGLPLVHRDVKPANLVEGYDGGLVLVDPSTLRGVDATHLTRVGTPVFSAPEVMTGRFGPPADVYSFAATVVALLTGARGEGVADLLDEAHTLDLPSGVADALSPVPGDRPASCRAVLEAGEELADHDDLDWLDVAEAVHRSNPPTLRYATPQDTPPGVSPQVARPEDHAARPPQPPVRRAGHLGAWTLLLAGLIATPSLALGLGLAAGDRAVALIAAAAVVHVVAHLAARRSLAAAILVPPVAWALLLGRRVRGGTRRRAWGAAVFTAALAPVTVTVLLALLRPDAATQAGAGVAASLVLLLVAAAVANAPGAAAGFVRLLLVPLWAAGAVVLVLGGMLLSPFGVARGLAWSALTSVVDGVRGPAMMRPPTAPNRW